MSAGDTVSGATVIGNTAQGVTGGSFGVGSEILVIGWKATAPAAGGSASAVSDGFLKFAANLNGGYQPASAPGGASTSFITNTKRATKTAFVAHSD